MRHSGGVGLNEPQPVRGTGDDLEVGRPGGHRRRDRELSMSRVGYVVAERFRREQAVNDERGHGQLRQRDDTLGADDEASGVLRTGRHGLRRRRDPGQSGQRVHVLRADAGRHVRIVVGDHQHAGHPRDIRRHRLRCCGIEQDHGGPRRRDGPPRQHPVRVRPDQDADRRAGSRSERAQPGAEIASPRVQLFEGQQRCVRRCSRDLDGGITPVPQRDVGEGRPDGARVRRLVRRQLTRLSGRGVGESQRQIVDAGVRCPEERIGERVEHRQELPVVFGDLRVVVSVGVRLDADHQRGILILTGYRVDVDRQVVGWADGQDVKRGSCFAAGEFAVEQHEVEHRAGAFLSRCARCRPGGFVGGEVGPDVLAAVALVPQRAHERGLGGRERVGDAARSGDPGAQRHDVGDRERGGTQRGGRPRGDRELEDHLVALRGRAAQIGREGGDENVGQDRRTALCGST